MAEAASAAVAFLTLRDFKPHLVVSDVDMPKEDGCSLIRRIRALGADLGGAIPAIAVSGGASGSARLEALRAGFSAHLAKPVAVAELLGTVMALSLGVVR